MVFTERIAPVLPSIEFQLARSLPVFDCHDNEVVFFYKVKDTDNQQYSVTEIRYIVFRNMKSGEIKKENAHEIIPASILKEVYTSACKYVTDAYSELHAEDEYLTWYEKAYQCYIACRSIDREITSHLAASFQRLVNGTDLKPVYQYLAGEFVKHLSIAPAR